MCSELTIATPLVLIQCFEFQTLNINPVLTLCSISMTRANVKQSVIFWRFQGMQKENGLKWVQLPMERLKRDLTTFNMSYVLYATVDFILFKAWTILVCCKRLVNLILFFPNRCNSVIHYPAYFCYKIFVYLCFFILKPEIFSQRSSFVATSYVTIAFSELYHYSSHILY